MRLPTDVTRKASAGSLGALLAAGFAAAAALVSWGPVQAQPASPEKLRQTYETAETALSQQRLEDAQAGYEQLAEMAPKTAEVHAKLGLVLYLQGMFEDAIPAFQQALGLKPGLPSVNSLLAISLAGIGRHAEAIEGLEAGFSDPADSDLRRLIGLELQRSYVALGQTDRAARVVVELGKAYPDDPEVLYHSGRFHADMATASMQRLLAVAPDSVWGHQASGDALESMGDHALAIVEYRKALEKRPGQPGVHYSIGMAIQSSGGSAGSEADAEEAYRQELSIDPSHAIAAYELGEILRKQGRLEEARAYFQQAVAARPQFGLGRIGLGRVLRELEQPALARKHLEEAVRTLPGNEVARYQLALAYRALGQLASAEREMQEFRRLQRAAR